MSIRESFRSAVNWVKDTVTPIFAGDPNPWNTILKCKAEDRGYHSRITILEIDGAVSIHKAPVTMNVYAVRFPAPALTYDVVGEPVCLASGISKEEALVQLDALFEDPDLAAGGHRRAYESWKAKILSPAHDQNAVLSVAPQ